MNKVDKVDYEWQRPYVAAVLETDRSRLAQRIEEASAAIDQRMLELNRDHHGTPEERMAIEFALSGLKILSEDAPQAKPHS
jgi:hypothetical protein